MSDLIPGAAFEAEVLPAPELTLTHLDALPTLAPIAVKLLQITSDDDSDVRGVVDALRGDQSLTAKILSIANSPAIGARAKVPTLERAVVLLGFQAVRNIALAVKVFECLAPRGAAGGERRFERTEFWKHSLAVGCAARRLAASQRQLNIDPEEAFVAGLLHDLGKVALDAVFPKAYERAAAETEERRGDIADSERAILGVDHTVAGRHLAKRWGLPRVLQEVIWLHHVSTETLTAGVESPTLVGLVQLANTFAREQRIGVSGDCAFYEASSVLAERLGIAEAELGAISRDVVGDVAEYASLLGLDQETPETLYLKSLTRANDELGRLNAELLGGNRRLTAAARYFRAITQFDRQLSALSDLGAVVAAIVDAGSTALQGSQLAAFGVHDQRTAIEVCWVNAEAQRRESTTQRLTDEMREWLQEPGEAIGATISGAPRPVRSMLALMMQSGTGDCWLMPIVHDQEIAGGIVFSSERDERAELDSEIEELRCFLASLGLALGRVNAQAAAHRLSEDLAESNRRLQQMQAEVLRTRALSMIAEMAAGAGHELNGPLTVISGRAQMLRDSMGDPEAQHALEQIHSKAHECAQIVTELMDFARPQPPKPGVTDLGSLLAEVRDAWAQLSGLPASRFRIDPPETSPRTGQIRIAADREQIRSVLDEIVRNATDAVADNAGSITILWRTGLADAANGAAPAPRRESPAKPAARRWVEITVQDTGCGMAPAVAQRVFDPFFSHRRAGRGRGLGLARAYRIIEAHGGRIWVVSQPDEGTAFHVMLPQVADG